MKVRIKALKQFAARHMRTVTREAVELLRRKKFSYSFLALTLTAGSLYLSGVRAAVVTDNGQTPGPAANSQSAHHGQPQVLQTVTGQASSQPNENATPPAASGQSHTSVIVNGTDIPIPPDGEAHTTMTNDGGITSISISHNSSGDNSYSSLNVQVSSHSTASKEGN